VELRPEVALVVFDSTAAPGVAAVYAEGCGEELAGDEVERDPDLLSPLGGHRPRRLGHRRRDGPARHRLYRATASTHFLLGGDDERIEAIP